MRKKILLTLTVLALASVTALAANKDGIVIDQGRKDDDCHEADQVGYANRAE